MDRAVKFRMVQIRRELFPFMEALERRFSSFKAVTEGDSANAKLLDFCDSDGTLPRIDEQIDVLSGQLGKCAIACAATSMDQNAGSAVFNQQYGATFVAARPCRVATLNLGYADGLFRALAPALSFRAGDRDCPVIGRISMDLVAADVTGADVGEGDWLDLPFDLPALAAASGAASGAASASDAQLAQAASTPQTATIVNDEPARADADAGEPRRARSLGRTAGLAQ